MYFDYQYKPSYHACTVHHLYPCTYTHTWVVCIAMSSILHELAAGGPAAGCERRWGEHPVDVYI